MAEGVAQRAQQLLAGRRQSVYESTDRLVAAVLTLHGVAGAGALAMAPSPWALAAGITAGLAIVAAGAATLAVSGTWALRYAMAILLMVATGLAPLVTGRSDLLPMQAAVCLVLLALYLDVGVLVAALSSAVLVNVVVGLPADPLEVGLGITCVAALLIGSCLRGQRAMTTSAAGQAELERASQTAREIEGRARRQTVELRAVDDRFRLVCGSAPVGVSLMGVDGELVFVNPRWSAISGLAPDAAVSGAWASIVHDDDRARVLGAWRTAIEGDREFAEEYRLLTPQGERIVQDRRASVASEGRATGFVGFLEDVTARKQAEDALREGKALAESANRAKSEFLANMSHEIRTPMNGIIGLTELVLETTLTADQRDQLSLVKVSADALLVIVNDILDFSKVEAGKLALDPVDFALRDCVDEAVRGLAVGAKNKGLQLVYDVQPDLPDALHGDARRLRQVITNLVGNAIKFTERGEIVVEVKLREAALTPDEVRLEVTVGDTGIGISPAAQASIFEPFVQADTSISRRFGGTGLGLAISSRFVALLGGRLTVTSQLGAGSCFRFDLPLGVRSVAADRPFVDVRLLLVDGDATRRRTLASLARGWGATVVFAATGAEAARELVRTAREGPPYQAVVVAAELPDMMAVAAADMSARPEIIHVGPNGDLRRTARPAMVRQAIARACGRTPVRADAAQPTSPSGSSTGRALKLLVVDDNAVNRLVAVRFLEHAGHRCVAVCDGGAAIAAVVRERWDAILMDVQMPGIDGPQATAEIRRLEAAGGVRTPIIAVTAHASSEDRDRLLAAGMDDFVSKPLSRDRLFAAVNRTVAPAVMEPAA